jgi:photosystem II stability/assembly factor-like uncharacterized protein
MQRSRRILAAMGKEGVCVVDLEQRSTFSSLKENNPAEATPGDRYTGCLTVAVSPSNENVFFAGCRKGLYKSTDGGSTWNSVGLQQYKIYSLAFHPNTPTTMYAGTEPAFVFKSLDGGETWTELEGFRKLPGRNSWSFPPPPHLAHVKSIAVHPFDSEIIYCGVEEGGVIRTTDSGETWKYVSKGDAETFRSVSRFTGMYQDIHKVVLWPRDPDVLFVSTGDGLYRSDDCGTHWINLDRGNRIVGLFKKYFVGPIVIHPAKPEIIYTVTSLGSASVPNNRSSIYKSSDAGKSFTEVETHIPDLFSLGWNALAVDPLQPDVLYLGTSEGTLYSSADGGETWTDVQIKLPNSGILSLVCVP